MPSFRSTITRGQIGLLNPLLQRMDLEKERQLQNALGRIQMRVLTPLVHFEDISFDGFQAALAVPKRCCANRAILYLHGGAYTAGGLDYARGFGGILAHTLGRNVLCVDYRLAPENPFPAALQDAMTAYRWLLSRYEPQNISFIGESAGGGLCYSLALFCIEEEVSVPASIVAISPWTDLTMERDTSDIKDPLLTQEGLLYSAKQYAGEAALDHPLISPLFGNMTGLPPSLIFVGSDEILKDDSLMMAEKLLEAGSRCEVQLEEGLWHAYVLYGMPESAKAIERINEFINWEEGYGQTL